MDTAIINALFQAQRLAYILIDQRLTIVDSSGAAAILDSFGPFDIGSSLVKRVPELVGSEPMVAALLAGATEPYRIEFVNRPAPDGGQRYLTLTMLPYAGARSDARLLVMLADTTGEGQTVQQLAQGRNELRLLREQLTQRNGELDAAIADLRRLDELKSMFVAIAAHELNNPLAPILGYAISRCCSTSGATRSPRSSARCSRGCRAASCACASSRPTCSTWRGSRPGGSTWCCSQPWCAR